ncbi:Insecticidal toxin complex/plasmid viulence protein [Paenibacillus curdlanolyticus YK9]|uniref:Insecticidal toxin complex/plasmid viulence protein n=1 Tax=Paenibacillus curdlanolyticus YK9 TaxID=717606 RepID=E0I5I4_9BACL|nr:neuraminidase-like domain-containing protein [Paenibacillus curdlanolyticus]EFM12226.1 Insecticidal toxin complex/plasmid viulence protein [Paenibacillus curdlanolyticus YK9]
MDIQSYLSDVHPSLAQFYANNPNFDVNHFKFSNTASVEALNGSSDQHAEALSLLQGYQRLLRLTNDPRAASALMQGSNGKNGGSNEPIPPLHSALQIAAINPDQFVSTYGPLLGDNGEAQAADIHAQAKHVEAQTMHQWASISQLTAPHTRSYAANSISTSIVQHYEALPNYQDIFGTLNYCECDECKSIFGPAAYLVDLMRIVNQYITEPNRSTIPANMALSVRRPDLATIPLTCESTNKTMPYLQIVNERLEETVKTALSITGDVYQPLAGQVYPFSLPFQYPLEQMRIYLNRMSVKLQDLYAAVGSSPLSVAAETLGLSQEELMLISTSTTDETQLKAFYGVSDLTTLSDVATFCKQTGLTLVQLQSLFNQDLSADEWQAGLSNAFFINYGLAKPLQVNDEGSALTIANLTDDALDRIHRFLRLSNKLGWSYVDLDWALHCVKAGAPKLDAQALIDLAKLKTAKEQWKLSMEQAGALIFDLKTYGQGDAAVSNTAFDKLFNGPESAPYHPADEGKSSYAFNAMFTDNHLSWTVGATDTDNMKLASRIAAALKVSQGDLSLLASALFGQQATIPLTVGNLSVLDRYVMFGSLLGMPAAQFSLLLSLFNQLTAVPALDAWTKLKNNADRLKRSRLNVYELDYVANGNVSDYVDPLYRTDALDGWLSNLPQLIASAGSDQDADTVLQKLVGQMAAFFHVQSVQIAGLVDLFHFADMVAVFTDPKQQATAEARMKQLSQWLVLMRKLALTSDDLAILKGSLTAFGIADAAKLTASNVLDVYGYQELKVLFNDVNGAISRYMTAASDNDAASAITDMTGLADTEILSVFNAFPKLSRIERLYLLQQIMSIMKSTGANFSLLRQINKVAGLDAAGHWADYVTAADNLLMALRARLGGDDWETLYLQVNGAVQEKQRTALISTALNALSQKDDLGWIENSRNLYEYLLIDVEMSGSATISYIKEALNATQLYLQRSRERLEPGVINLDIPPVWWSWMINYRIWEANRQVFLYPENYIDPSYRQNKTALFADFENTLKQGDITKTTVEAAYRKYLDRFAELAKLKVVDTYHTHVTDPTHENAQVTYLFARTETQPYKYYYLTRDEGNVWSEWNEIKVAINSDTVSPVYVFNRLFLFWVEQKAVKDSGAGSTQQKSVKATIRYTFYNFSGSWVAPQTLTEDAVIWADNSTFIAQDGVKTLFNAAQFDPAQQWWKKVYPLKIERNNYLTPNVGANPFEKLVLFFGPMIDVEGISAFAMPSAPVSTSDTLQQFENQLYKVSSQFNLAKKVGHTGFLPVFQPIVINDDLQSGFIVNPDEYIISAKEALISETYFRPEIDRSSGQLNLIDTAHILYDNYAADSIRNPSPVIAASSLGASSFVSTALGIDATQSTAVWNGLVKTGYFNGRGLATGSFAFDQLEKDIAGYLAGQTNIPAKTTYVLQQISQAIGTVSLSGNMRGNEYEVLTVKNHPAAFLFKGDKEAFLLMDIDPDLMEQVPTISEALLNPDTIFTPASFISTNVNIDANGSQTIYNLLVKGGFLDQNGVLKSYSDAASLTEYLQPQLVANTAAVVNVLMNSPMFTDLSFVAPSPIDIEVSGSQKTFNTLIKSGYLDPNGRILADIDFYELNEYVKGLMAGQPNEDLKVRHVMDTLYQWPFPVSVGFLDRNKDGIGSMKYQFSAFRLTTAAVHRLSSTLFTGGIDKLLSLDSQQIPVEAELLFKRFQFDSQYVISPDASDGAQVDFWGAYKTYYWELFFHAPYLIADLLKTNQSYQDAEKWYQYIFNPTLQPFQVGAGDFQTSTIGLTSSQRIYKILVDQNIITDKGAVSADFSEKTPISQYFAFLDDKQIDSVRNRLLNDKLGRQEARFWQFSPFRNHTLESLKDQLTNPQEIAAYNMDPFDPDAIAGLRIGAYEKAIVMAYIDNLLQWGDSYFAQYTWESIVTATMMYVYAYDLLGPRPENLGKAPEPAPKTFADLLTQFKDDIPQFFIALEQEAPGNEALMDYAPFNALDTYFCVPENERFIAYWDRVEDRLFKIRHCLNIQGVPQSLALFEPPIDPAQLIRMVSAGVNPLSALKTANQGVPYRFEFMLERAKSLAGTLTQFGGSLLAALERNDAEGLALLQSTHEKNILNLTTMIKEKQLEEMANTLASLSESRNNASFRHDHYSSLYDEDINGLEITDIALRGISADLQTASIAIHGISIAAYLAPNIFGLADGGMQFGDAVNAGAAMADGAANVLDKAAGLISTSAQYLRRREEWGLQRDIAASEVRQLDLQIAGGNVRGEMLQRELDIHQQSMKQQDEMDQFLRSKFTGQELYQWMISRLSTAYFQCYQLAVDMALAAQSAYQYELERQDQFLQFDYWDNLHRGLLAGEGLLLALNQMEKAYLFNNTRDLELEKTVSLLHLDPIKFIAFKGGMPGGTGTQGKLDFELSEKLFDFDFPGHYCRKIKSISISIPAVVGPYQNINATLVQNRNAVVVSANDSSGVSYLLNPSDPAPGPDVLRQNHVAQQVAVTRGMNDAGLFVLDFKDERYLPFEGTGAVSSWTLNLPPETNRFDLGNISDVIVKIQYTAKDGGAPFASKVKQLLHADSAPYPYTPAKTIDLKQAFPSDWFALFSSPAVQGVQQISFPITDRTILTHLSDVSLLSATVLIQTADLASLSDKDKSTPFLSLKLGDNPIAPINITNSAGTCDLSNITGTISNATLQFTLSNTPDALLLNGALNPDALAGITVIITYQSNVFAKAATTN